MKWWGWLAIAIFGPVVWAGLIAFLHSVQWLNILGKENAIGAVGGGVVIIWGCCVAIPFVQKAIRAAKRGAQRTS